MVLSHRVHPDFSKRSLHLYHQRPWGQLRGYRVMHLCNNSVHCRESACTGPVVFKAVLVTDAAFAGLHGALIVPLFYHIHHSLLCDDVRYMSCCDNKHRHNTSEYIAYTEPGENSFSDGICYLAIFFCRVILSRTRYDLAPCI